MFMTYKKRGKRMVSDEFLCKAMERIAALDSVCQIHAENGDILCYLEDKAIAEGRTKPTDFPATCPDWAEEEAINRAILIGRLTSCPVYIVHLDRKSTRLNSSHRCISYAVFCLKKKKTPKNTLPNQT